MHDPTPRPQRGGWHGPLEVLIDEATLAARVQQLGAEITAAYAGRDLCLIGVLKGSFMFFADLVRAIHLPVTCEFIGISSYGNDTRSSGIVRITHDLQRSIEGQDVLLVEDIVDSGLSMRYLLDNFATRRPRSVGACALLKKPSNMQVEVKVDHVGFSIPDHFVVGYGLDSRGILRNVPFVGVMPPAAP